jgi:putative endonuclease
MAFVYILRCGDGSYYVGSTRSLHSRVDAHMMGKGALYTSRRLPVVLLWHQEFESIADAFWWEKRIQNWSRAKREALMRGDYVALRAASKKVFRSAEAESAETADPDR